MLLELKNIKKYFPIKGGFFGLTGGIVKAVNGVDLTVHSGENISLVGESGCGKTTLARIILKLLELDSGSIIFDGQDITQSSNRQLRESRKNMQMVFQYPYSSLHPRYTLGRIMKEGLMLAKKQYGSESEKQDRMQQLTQ